MNTKSTTNREIAMPRLGRDAVTQEAVTTFTYDNYGNVTTVTDTENNKTLYTHDAMGNVLRLTDAKGKIWTKTYDNAGSMRTETSPLNHTTATDYDKVGNRTKLTDALNNITQYFYDRRDNPIRTVDAMGGVWRIEYNADSKPVKRIDAEGKIQSAEYDLDGRLVKSIDGNGNAIGYLYGDPASGLSGLRTKVVYPTFTREFKYDTQGRVVQTIDILDATTQHMSSVTYDSQGNKTSETDAEGRTTRHEYDVFNRLSKTTDANNGVTQLAYDARDNLLSVTDAKLNVTRYEYDRVNAKKKEIRPLGQTIAFDYDAVGSLIQMTDPKGQVRKYVYDDAGRRVTDAYYATSTATAADKTVTFSYSAVDVVTGYGDGHTSAVYTLDALNRKTTEAVNYGPFTLSYSYTYYANGQKKSFTDASGTTYSYTYDANNQLAGIQLPIGTISYNGYNWLAPTAITLPGGTTKQFTYDPLLRLKSIVVKDPGQNEVLNHRYSYDKVGNVLNTTSEHGAHNYTYDPLYRLTQATAPTLPTEGYTYDPVHNRISDSSAAGAWTYNANNELQASGSTSYSYDANGNTVQRTRGTAMTDYRYDGEDRLTEVRDGTGAVISTYYYDPFGRRRWKKVNDVTTYFFYAEEGLVSEHDAAGAAKTGYGYLPNGAWTANPIFLRTGAVAQYYFFHNDRLGTPTKLTNTNGAVVWSATYTAFGDAAINVDAVISNPLRFPGQYYDDEIGLAQNWHRYYDSAIGRYISADPTGLEAGVNVFVYADANPANRTDPWGLVPIPIQFTQPGEDVGAGCGDGWRDIIIPDRFVGFDFSIPCRDHDRCWDTCRNSKEMCDAQFDRDLARECQRMPMLLWFMLGSDCQKARTTYRAAVVYLGKGAYCAAQEKACPDCDPIPGCR